MTKYECISIILSILSFSGTWLTLAIAKFQKLKNAYKKYTINFAKNYSEANNEIKSAILNDNNLKKLLIDGQTIDDEVRNFTDTWKQLFKCISKPF